MVTSAAKREALEILKVKGLSERAACRIAGVSRRIVSYELRQPTKDKELGARLIEASGCYPRFGYWRIAVMTDQSIGRVWRLWSVLGLNLPYAAPGNGVAEMTYAFLERRIQTVCGRMTSYMTG
jgi:hypothetical protein